MVAFPEVTPSSMDFTAPEFPIKTNTSLSGVVSRRAFGNRGSRAVLSLNFDNLPDATAVEFLNSWKLAKGQLESLSLSSIVFNGASSDLSAYLSDGGDALIWHFSEPPQLQRVKPGISSVRVVLEATRDF
jgi:hypothetical protein